MNRIIKFRGKYAQAHEWVYGHYYNNCDCGANHDIIIGYNPETLSAEEYLIKYQFLGQFTGLVDINGKELYEGDLFMSKEVPDIKFRCWRVKGGFATNTGVSIWRKDIELDYPFPLVPLSDEQTVSWFEGTCYIIGNIHDTPELINTTQCCGSCKYFKNENTNGWGVCAKQKNNPVKCDDGKRCCYYLLNHPHNNPNKPDNTTDKYPTPPAL